jgi:hypothetical protein
MNPRLANTPLLVLGVLVAVGLGELTDRSYLAATLATSTAPAAPRDKLNYSVRGKIHARFDLEYGYSFEPNQRGARIKVRNGYPLTCRTFRINALGNTDLMHGSFQEGDLRRQRLRRVLAGSDGP